MVRQLPPRAPGISGPPSFGRQQIDSRWGILYKTRHLVFYSFLNSLFFCLSKYENLILVGGFSIKPGIWFLIVFCFFNVFLSSEKRHYQEAPRRPKTTPRAQNDPQDDQKDPQDDPE